MADSAAGLAAIFFDGGYLDKLALHEHHGARLNLDRLATKIAQGKERFRAYYYHCARHLPKNPSEEDKKAQASQDKFFDRLRRLPRFEVRLGTLKPRGIDSEGNPIFHQKGVDILLAIDMLRTATNRCAVVAVLVAGDGDYAPLVYAVKDLGMIVRLYHSQGTTPHCSYSDELWSACDERFPLDSATVQSCLR